MKATNLPSPLMGKGEGEGAAPLPFREGRAFEMGRKLFCLFFLTCFFLMSSAAMAQSMRWAKEMGMKEIREPALAGSWYPGDPVFQVDVILEMRKKIEGQIVALVSPQAG
jgi:hypothetical protein